jgi:type VI protein secretion system component Hcp
MASEAYLRIRGRSGVKGSSRGGWIPLESLSFGTPVSGRGAGKMTGRRIHDSVKVTKFIDSTTPLLLRALCKPEVDELEFRFRGSVPGRDGKRPMLRCRVGKAVVVRRKVERSPGGGKGTDLGTEEIVLRCSDLKFCSD